MIHRAIVYLSPIRCCLLSRCKLSSLLRGLSAGLLIAALAESVSMPAGARSHKKPPKTASALAASPLTEEQKALHALNRLTFGPRPGDVEKVEAMGVEKWIAMQLDPEQIDDSALTAELANYPAMRLSQQQLIRDFPPSDVAVAAGEGKIAIPQEPAVRSIYRNQIDDSLQRKKKQAEQAAMRQAPAQEAGAAPQAPMGEMPSASMAGAAAPPPGAASEESEVSAKQQKLLEDLASTEIVNLPPARRLERLIEMAPAEFRTFLKDLTRDERAQLTGGMSPAQKETVFALIDPTALVSAELLQTRLLTDVDSQRQLQAVMTDFWLNHFNVFLGKGPFARWYLADYQQNVIAPRAMGKFEDLLVATARSSAMLFYLDNHTSIGPHSVAAVRAQMNPNLKNRDPGLNENYGRELMELHTLGVSGGYTQRDVTEVAKVFTGWTIDEPRNGGGFTFNQRRHEPGPKYVLGETIQEDGEREGLEVLHMLASSPATAHFLSVELATRFVSDTPPPALVDRMAKTYLATDGDIREVLRTMFASPEFWSSDAYRAKVKTPEEFVISAIRATDGQIVRPAAVLGAMNQLGMSFYGCQTPNGYPWTAATWVNTGDLLNRMNIALALSSNRLGTVTDLDALISSPASGEIAATVPAAAQAADASEQKELALEKVLLASSLSSQTRSELLDQVREQSDQKMVSLPVNSPAALRQAGILPRMALVQMSDMGAPIPPPVDREAARFAGLLLGSPEFQKR